MIAKAIWSCFRFPPSLRMVEALLAERGIVVSHETIRRWALRFRSIHGCAATRFRIPADTSASHRRELRTAAVAAWTELTRSAA